MEKEVIDMLAFEKEAVSNGYKLICGVDEAGRGPLAGPVCAAAVILPEGHIIEGVNDSKKLSEKKRESLFDIIKEQALSYSIALVYQDVIDDINIREATKLAMKKAVEGLDITPDFVMVDGNFVPDIDIDSQYVIKGDAKSMSIAAASILAKVTRDRYMLEIAGKYPQYQFEKHKGYGTKLHYEMLDKYGESDIHRKSFLKSWYAKK